METEKYYQLTKKRPLKTKPKTRPLPKAKEAYIDTFEDMECALQIFEVKYEKLFQFKSTKHWRYDFHLDPSKYTLDSKFGTVVFNDVTALTMPLKATYTTGAVTQTTIASDLEEEYELFFKGINKATKKHMAVRLWRTKKSPETTFPLIHSELGQ